MRPQALRLVRIVASMLVALGLVALAREVDWPQLWGVLKTLSLPLLALAAALNVLNMLAKSGCWWVLLGDVGHVPALSLCRYTIGSFALSAVLPFRAGEAVRVGLLRQRHGIALTRLLRIVATEKVLDVVAMLLLVSPLPLWAAHDAHLAPFLRPLALLEALLGAVLVVGIGVALFGPAHLWPRAIRATPPGMLARATASLVMGWCVDWALVMLVMYMVGIPPLPWMGLWVLLVVNAAIAVPALPGQLGTLELGAAKALVLLDVPTEQGLAFGLTYHAVQLGPLLAYLVCDGRFLWRQGQPTSQAPPVTLPAQTR